MTEFEGVRSATPEDIDTLVAIATAHRATLPEQRGGELLLRVDASRGDVRSILESALVADGTELLVGTFDAVVFGYALARIEELVDGGKIGVVDDFIVQPEARSVGIGAAVMSELLTRLEAAGCLGVDSRALPGDRSTKNFFEGFGLKARLLTVHYRFE